MGKRAALLAVSIGTEPERLKPHEIARMSVKASLAAPTYVVA